MRKNLGTKKQIAGFSILSAVALALSFLGSNAVACSIDQSGPMPICGGLRISPETDVIVVENHRSDGLTNVLLGPDRHSANYVNIVVGEVRRPITIVVSHYNAAVLNFSGNVDQVDQVIAMGARRLGWDHVATTGIDVRKVNILPVIGRDRNLRTSCSAPPNACVPEQYFQIHDEEKSPFSSVPLNPHYVRMKPTTLISTSGKSLVVIPKEAAPTEDAEAASASKVEEFRWPENWHEEIEYYNTTTDGLSTFIQDQLVSPTSISLNGDLPSWAGILGLVENGSIRPAGDYETDPDLIGFSDAFNERYRTRFDQDFSFEPRIDFVLKHSFRGEIPRDLRKADRTPVIFLRNSGRTLTRNAGDTGRFCFFSPSDKLTQPRTISSSGNADWKSQCKAHSLNRRIGLSPTLASFQLDAAISLENHKKWGTRLCPLMEIPTDAEVIVLSTQYGRLGTGVGFKHCNIETSTHAISSGSPAEIIGEGPDQCEAGEVDVRVDRSGPIFLFLKGSGAIKWNFDVSDESEIVGVVTVNDRRQSISGLPEGVPFNQYVTDDRDLPNGCRNALLNANPMAGGPAIQLFEMMLNRTSGRDIDLLINNGISPEPENQTPDRIRDYTTFLVK